MTKSIDWTDAEPAAKSSAGNWRQFSCFAWSRGFNLADADNWTIWYTTGRDAGLLAQSNNHEIANRLAPFMDDEDPDVAAESHSHWAVGYLHGFSIRVFDKTGGVTPAFKAMCQIHEQLERYPVLNEQDYSDREYSATLENYQSEMWACRSVLPEGWEGEVYSWFTQNGRERFTENRDDQGGWAPRPHILEALQDLGLLPVEVIS